jgi:hypothetical protein
MKNSVFRDIRLCRRSACYLLQGGFLLLSFFDTEDICDIFIRNVGWLSMDYTALYPTKSSSEKKTVKRKTGSPGKN